MLAARASAAAIAAAGSPPPPVRRRRCRLAAAPPWSLARRRGAVSRGGGGGGGGGVAAPFPTSRRRGTAAAAARGGGGAADIPEASATVEAAARALLFDGAPRRSSSALAPAAPPPPPPPPAGSWLGPAMVGVAVGVAGSWAAAALRGTAAATPAPAPAMAAPAPAAAAPTTTPAATAAAAAAPPKAKKMPTRPSGVFDAMKWYRRLPRLHYLQAGGAPLPRIAASELGVDVAEALRVQGGGGGAEVLLAFQDAADAEFALACMAKGKSSAGAVLASGTPAQLEGRLGPVEALFVLPPGRLPIKVVSSAGLKQLLLLALLQDLADRAGTVIAPSAGAAAAAVVEQPAAAAAQSNKDDIDGGSSVSQQQQQQQQKQAPRRRPAPPPPPPPPPPPAPRAAAAAAAVVDKQQVIVPKQPTPPPPAPAPAAPMIDLAEDDDDDDADQPFAPVTLAGDDEERQESLLDDYYRLEQSWSADRLANVASAAQARIESMRSIDSVDEDKVDRSAGDQVDSASINPMDDDDDDDDSKSTVVNKGTRTKREGEEAPPALAPEELQRSVLEALKEIDPTRDDRDKKGSGSNAPSRPLIGTAGDDGEGDGSTWWKRRFRVVYLPTVKSEGTFGFLQVDISADGTAKDVRVVAFEDRIDAAAAAATMQQLESFASATCSVAAVSTDKIEAELAEAWRRQQADGLGASAPSNLLVFRRKKLPLRVGMSEEDFLRAIIYGGAAQTSLLQTGFKF